MSTSSQIPVPPESPLLLNASYREWEGSVAPEQSASFNLALENRSGETVETLDIECNQWNPTVRVFEADGSLRFEESAEIAAERYMGHTGEPTQPPKIVKLEPGQSKSTFVNLCDYADCLPPGSYFFQAVHKLQSIGGGVVVSEKIPFCVEPAGILASVSGYDSWTRRRSSLAWIAKRQNAAPQLLVRWSGTFHATTMWGGMPHGEAPSDARVAVSQVAIDAKFNEFGWVAVHWPDHMEMLHHDMSAPFRRTGPMEFPIADGILVPRFPDRGTAAVAMVAGLESDGRPALAGVLALRGAAKPKAWKQRILAKPEMAACAFEKDGPITVLLVNERNGLTRISRIAVDEDGWLVAPERIVRTTFNKVLAVAADLRKGVPPGFVVLEAHPLLHDHLTRVQIPVTGDPPPPVASRIQGWPSIHVFGVTIPFPVAQVALETAADGSLWMAFTEPRGGLFAGNLMQNSVSQIRSRELGKRIYFPHISLLPGLPDIAGFTETGNLFHSYEGGH